MISANIYRKFPDIHRILAQNIITLSLNADGKDFTEESIELRKRKLIVKEALWALSNIAACPPIILESLLTDGTLQNVV